MIMSSYHPAGAGVFGVADRHAPAVPHDMPSNQAKPGKLPPSHAEDPAVRPSLADPAADPETDPDFRPDLPAAQVDAALRRALNELQRAERNVVLWFSEMNRRSLFRELGFASIHQYASDALGFSSNRTYRFLHLAAELERLPRLRASLATGEIGWTKAREVVKVASAATEERWIAAARRTGRRELEQKVHQARLRAAAQRKADPAQGVLAATIAARSSTDTSLPAETSPHAGSSPPTVLASPASEPPIAGLQSIQDDSLGDDAPATVVFRLTPLQLARYEAQMECIRKTRVLAPDVPREEILLQALDLFLAYAREEVAAGQAAGRSEADATGPGRAETGRPGETEAIDAHHPAGGRRAQEPPDPNGRLLPRGNNGTNYKIVIYKCALCERSIVHTQHGSKEIAPAQSAAIECDATIQQTGERNMASIPPAIRQAVLTRDHHRCRAPGCRNTRYLEVHHIHPRDRGGSNRPENLVTLCSSCHRLWHERTLDGLPLAKLVAKK